VRCFRGGGEEALRRLERERGFRGSQAKPYQVKQVRGVIVTHGLVRELEDDMPQDEPILERPQDS
jgi:hypothetical protein